MERVEEEEEKGTESSSPPPPSLSSQAGQPQTIKPEPRSICCSSKEEDKGERSHRDPVFDLMILSHSFNRAHGHSHLPRYTEEKRKTLLEMINSNSAER